MIHVLLATDRRALIGTVVAGRSALEHTSDLVTIHVLSYRLDDRGKQCLEESWRTDNCAGVRFYNLHSSDMAGLKTSRYHHSPLTHARLYVDRLSHDIEKVIYIDVDTIVCEDLCKLAEMDLTQHTIAAVRERVPEQAAQQRALRLNLSHADNYFNAGVCLINLNRWREFDVGTTYRQLHATRHDVIEAPNQDTMNMALDGDSVPVDGRWNRSQWQADPTNPSGIVHCMGPVKPWHPDYDGPFRDLFFEVLDRTALAGWRPRTMGTWGRKWVAWHRGIPSWHLIRTRLQQWIRSR